MIRNQRPFLFTVGFVCLLVLVLSPQAYGQGLFLAGLALTLLSCLPAVLLPWRRFASMMYWLIPLLQFAAIAALRAGGNGYLVGLSLVVVFPVIWLAWFMPRSLAVHIINFTATSFIVILPILLGQGSASFSLEDLAGRAIIPVILTVIGLFAANVSRSIDAQQQELVDKDRQLRLAAAESERRAQLLNTVIETVPVGVVVVDAEGHDMMMNSHQRELHQIGVPREVPDPREDQLLVFGEDKTTPLPAEERPVRRAVKGSSFTHQLIWLGDQRHRRALSVSANSMKDREGSSTGSVIVFSDVTELVEALEVKDEFLQAMSHELRTPLTSILGYIDLVLEEAESLPAAESLCANLQVAERNASRLLQMVTDLLTTAARPALKVREADLAEVVHSSVASARLQADAAGVTLIDGVGPSLRGRFDPDRMHQVVDNLISNAIKYSAAGATVSVDAWHEDRSLHITVTDTGQGISERDQREIFEKFFRTEEARDSAAPGIGLGLNIIKHIVDDHHGSIRVTSEPGRGSTFTVTIPVQ
ncbi:sensor histidine kinase [Nesterenkonia ebinurensis]|uniref:sensor histidine kinase n=1 Tax=Nesterenkonia ebinurensis TaxID=2608252 RepID=UPI00168A71C9|nr:ATP-binding protein [Nesterenkonia ebinurensis]